MRLGAAVLALHLALAWAAQAGETVDRVRSTGVLRLASDPAYPPQSFINADGEMDGFDVDVARAIAERLDVRVEFVFPAWRVIVAGGWGGRWDISVGSMTPTRERAAVLAFPAVYYYAPASFAVHADSLLTMVDTLNGKRIGVCAECTYEAYLRRDLTIDAEGVPPFTYRVTPGDTVTYRTDTDALADLARGVAVRLDAVLTGLPTIRAAIERGEPVRALGEPVFYEPLAIAVDRGDPEWAAKIAAIVQELHADGTLSRLSMQWYGADLTRAR